MNGGAQGSSAEAQVDARTTTRRLWECSFARIAPSLASQYGQGEVGILEVRRLSWLLLIDESGHDHRNMPYEVRGGIALHAGRLWSFVQDVQRRELEAHGTALSQFRTEIKGSKLLDSDRFTWARQAEAMSDEERRKHCRGFLTKGLENKPPTSEEFTAYGQASLEMAHSVFQSLNQHGARLFAAAIPRDVARPRTTQAEEYLRKDQVFLLERYFYFLEAQREHGLLVLDAAHKNADQRFVRRLEAYFRKTHAGRYRTAWIVPTPLFVASDMTYAVQAADLCIYCVNWGYRLPKLGMDAPVRAEIETAFRPWLGRLQFCGDAYKDGNVYQTFGIVFVRDPYTSREARA